MASVGETFVKDGLIYEIINIDSNLVSITGYIEDFSIEDLQIPEAIKDNGVTYLVASIGEGAFCNCDSLTSVLIPDSVTSIGDLAFEDCSYLTEVTIGNGVTNIGDYSFVACECLTIINVVDGNTTYKSIDGNLYTKDGKTFIKYALGKTDISFTIPNSVTNISSCAFDGCVNLTSMTIGNSVTNIGDGAFAWCISLTSIIIPNSVRSIGNYAFSYCRSLTSITISDSVTSIGDYAFLDCSQLQKIHIECIQEACKLDISGPSFYGAPRTTQLIFKSASDLDFLGFTFNGKHSYYDFGIYRVIDGDRYTDELAPQLSDKVADNTGGDGQYYFGSQHKSKQFNIKIAFDNLTEVQLRQMKQWCSGKDLHDLIFDERPYKVYTAKINGIPSLSVIPFDNSNGKRIYKGEGTIQFICYWPYAHTPDVNTKISHKFRVDGTFGKDGKLLNNYVISTYPTKEQWAEASGLQENGTVCIGENPGDLPAPFILTKSVNVNAGETYRVGDLSITIINEQPKGITWNSKTGIVSTLNDDGKEVPISYSGDSLGTIPVGGLLPDEMELHGATLKYHYWYY